MREFRPAAKLWVEVVVLGAVATGIGAHQLFGLDQSNWIAFGLLAVCAAFAHVFPIRPAFDNVTYHLTNAFMIAAAMLLAPYQAALLPALALAPDLWLRRGVPGVRVFWTFNAAQTAIATLATLAWLRWTGAPQLDDARDVATLLVGVGVFTLVQAVLVGVVVSLNSRRPLLQAGTLSPGALLSDVAIGLGGLLVGGVWLVKPALLVALPPLLFALHRATRVAHMAELAGRDTKTGLYNARHFERALEDELLRSQHAGRPLAILFVDLDRFKRVNDRHGHDAGDLVLREVAAVLTQHLRRGDVVARFGGEEFVALLPGATPEVAMELAEAVRAGVEAHRLTLPGGEDVRCTVSVGVATCPQDGVDAPTLLRRADAALYRAKQSRNAVARGAAIVPVKSGRDAEGAEARAAGRLRRLAPLMLRGTTAAGGLAAGWSLLTTLQHPDRWSALLPFLAVAIAAEFLHVNVYQARKQRIDLSFSMAAIMAAVAADPASAPLISFVASLVAVLVVMRQRSLDKVLFNVANVVLSSAGAAVVYASVRPAANELSTAFVAAALVAVVTYVAVNVGLVSVMISLHSGRPLGAVFRESGWFAPTNVLLGVTGAFIGGAYEQLGPLVVGMFITPVLLMRYTLAFYARRSQETIRTLEEQAATLEQQAERLEHQALHDALTDLPNRALLEQRLDALLREETPVSLLLLDLDRFKEINDTFGHHYGDLLLRQVGTRLQAAVNADQTVARLGGDEFGVVLPRTPGPRASEVAARLLAALRQPFVVEAMPVDVSGSIGVAVATDGDADPATLLRQADVAMYVAKRGRLGATVYRPDLDQYSPERLALVGALRHAIEQDQLRLFYQPQVDCRTGELVGVEALLRWQHPDFGWIPPDRFVPLAEHTGLIGPLTRWVLERALRQCRAWLDEGRCVPTAVNLSTHDLQDTNLPAVIAELLAATGVPGHCLRVEVTEGTLMADATRAVDVLARLRALGLQVAIDDFGTGYSSLAYLSRLPVDELKIDRSFLRGISADDSNAAIVRSTIGLGHELGLRVVAEGVEDQAAWELLQQFQCDIGQGYWLGRPVSSADLSLWLADRTAAKSLPRAA